VIVRGGSVTMRTEPPVAAGEYDAATCVLRAFAVAISA
jgi:hypothetical protein